MLKMKIDKRALELAMKAAPKEIEAEIIKAVGDGMVKIQLEAKAVHRFTARSGILEKSILSNVENSGGKIVGSVRVDDGLAKYGKWIHEGFHFGKRKLGKIRRRWQPDKFLYQAFDRFYPRVFNDIVNSINVATRKIGLSQGR